MSQPVHYDSNTAQSIYNAQMQQYYTQTSPKISKATESAIQAYALPDARHLNCMTQLPSVMNAPVKQAMSSPQGACLGRWVIHPTGLTQQNQKPQQGTTKSITWSPSDIIPLNQVTWPDAKTQLEEIIQNIEAGSTCADEYDTTTNRSLDGLLDEMLHHAFCDYAQGNVHMCRVKLQYLIKYHAYMSADQFAKYEAYTRIV